MTTDRSAFSAVRHQQLVDEVIRQLQERISLNQLEPGTKLPPEPELMAQFDVGRSTLREAVRVLVHAGLLEVRQGDGTYVRTRTAPDEPLKQRLQRAKIQEVYEMRRVLEIEIARLAAHHRDEEDLNQMRASLDKRQAALEAGDGAAFLDADISFHLAAGRGSPILLPSAQKVAAAAGGEEDIVAGVPTGKMLAEALGRARGLTVLGGVLDSQSGREFLALLEELSSEKFYPDRIAETYGRLWRGLAEEPDGALDDAWQRHLVRRLLEDENGFSRRASRGGLGSVGGGLQEQVRRDLRALQLLFELGAEGLRDLAARAAGTEEMWCPWRHIGVSGERPPSGIAGMLVGAEDWGQCVDALAEHFSRNGTGLFAKHRAFRWSGGCLSPVHRPDPVRLSELVGYDREREPLIRNTERFLAGLPAYHALLYGQTGTGKSSTVKAILNEYAGEGLRLVEIAKEDLKDLPSLLEALGGRDLRFVLFLDDLSFEEGEVGYKALKTFLEGSVGAFWDNVRVYAISNRRNIIRETFNEREGDLHPQDQAQDKQALVARFGLRLNFPAHSSRDAFLEMVEELSRRRGIQMDGGELRQKATQWERWHAGRSGRDACQFVDEIEAEMLEGRGRGQDGDHSGGQ